MLPSKTHNIYLGKTYHSRFQPSKHSFVYAVFYFGVNLELLEGDSEGTLSKPQSWRNILFGYNRRGIFSLWSADYLGEIPSTGKCSCSIKQKLLFRLREKGISAERVQSVELVTTPRCFGYAFNPLSIYYCYSVEKDEIKQLQVIVLEVSNTFGEKHLYILDTKETVEKPHKGYDVSFKIRRSFHVSPFNDRNGDYEIHLRDPQFGYHDIKIIVYADTGEDSSLEATHIYPSQEIKKLVAVLNGKQSTFNNLNLCYILFRYPFTTFLTFPRILYEAALLAYRKCLKVYPRPDPVDATIVKQNATFLERYAYRVVFDFLQKICVLNAKSLTLHMPEPLSKPVYINHTPDKAELSSDYTIRLSSYTFFTKWLFEDMPMEALGSSYAEGLWTCDDLAGFLTLIQAKERPSKKGSEGGWMLRGMVDTHRVYLASNQSMLRFQFIIRDVIQSLRDEPSLLIVANDWKADMKGNKNILIIPAGNYRAIQETAFHPSHIILLSRIPSDALVQIQCKYPLAVIVSFIPLIDNRCKSIHPLDMEKSGSIGDILIHFLMLLFAVLMHTLDKWGFRLIANFAPNTNPHEMNARFRGFRDEAVKEKLQTLFDYQVTNTKNQVLSPLQAARYERSKQFVYELCQQL